MEKKICKICGKELAKGAKTCPNCGTDQRNFFARHKVISVILALIILSTLGSITGESHNSKVKNNTKTTVSTEENKNSKETKKEPVKEEVKEPELSITAKELVNAYKENEVAADSKYKGKLATVTGTVESIDSSIGDEAVVSLSSGNEYDFESVLCYIKEDNKEKAGQLKKGQQITIVGKLSGETIGSPSVQYCEIK